MMVTFNVQVPTLTRLTFTLAPLPETVQMPVVPERINAVPPEFVVTEKLTGPPPIGVSAGVGAVMVGGACTILSERVCVWLR